MATITKLLLFLNVLAGARSEVCWYWDDILEEEESIICYTGCCDDECCDDYWSDGSIAGAAVGSIIGFVILISIIVAIIRVCCAAGRSRTGYVRRAQAIPAVTVVTNSTSANQIATPYMMYPQNAQTPGSALAPPSYEQVTRGRSAQEGLTNPCYLPKY